jgi:flagella basal body P-ring formation protein FlgA
MEHIKKIRLIASQAQTINNYKNRKMKLLLCCANIYFNKQYLTQNLIPTYAKIKVANTSTAAKLTQRKTQILRIKDEIRFLYKKKLQLNKQLYHSHLTAANVWGPAWDTIAEVTHNNINKHMDIKYQSIHKKINNLQ